MQICKTVVPIKFYPLHHGDSFYTLLPFFAQCKKLGKEVVNKLTASVHDVTQNIASHVIVVNVITDTMFSRVAY